jgi:hypothetical protein
MKRTLLLFAVIAFLSLTIAVPVFMVLGVYKAGAIASHAQHDMLRIEWSIEAYHDEYRNYPTGDNAAVFSTLQGSNANRVVFLQVKPWQINSDGQFVDPWGTPYDISVSTNENLRIRSAGPNGRFGDSDDMVSRIEKPGSAISETKAQK